MFVLLAVGFICLLLAAVGWLCDWPTDDDRSVATYATFRDELGGRR